MIIMEDDNRVWLEVFAISTQTRRLQLLLPFKTKPQLIGAYMNTGSSLTSDTINTKSYYIHDPSSDRTSVITFQDATLSNRYCIVVSSHQVLNILHSSTDHFRTLSWFEWGPNVARWFELPRRDTNLSAGGASVYFSFSTREFIQKNNMSSFFSNFNGVCFCDFNPRHIRRYLSTPSWSPHPMRQPGGGTNQTQSNQSRSPSFNSNSQYIVREEWVLHSSAFTEVVRSRLPFRVTLHHLSEHDNGCPIIGYNPIAVFRVRSSTFQTHQFLNDNDTDVTSYVWLSV
jgi:hypothetical protein